MFALLIAAAAKCAASSTSLLEANRLAMGQRPASGTVIARYAYEGQGLKGRTSTTFDLATGRFIDDSETPPLNDLRGFDGRATWFRDLSGALVPQGVNGRRAVAISEAYVNAQEWWRKDRGGADVRLIGCHRLKITPVGGNSFEATFDPNTNLLASVRQTATFGITTEMHFSDYRRRGGLLVATRIEMFTGDDPSTRELSILNSLKMAAVRPSGSYSMPNSHPSDWSLPPSGQVTVPFQLLNNHIILDVKVNGKGPFPFLLDTGGHLVLTPSTLKALSLTSKGESASGGGGEALTTNGYARVERIDAGGATLSNQTAVTLDFSPVDVEGIQLGGMIGLEFMERFIVRIDYGRRRITIMDPKKFETAQKRASGIAIPFSFYEHMPQIAGSLDGRAARFNIDTGSRSDVTMTSPYVEAEGLRAAYPHGVLVTEGWGVGGPTRSNLVRAGSMKLGPVNVERPIVGLSTAKRGAMSDSNYDGNVGSGALKRFVVTFDYGGATLYLKQGERLDPDTGHFDRSGMWLNRHAAGLEIMDVTRGGPADVGGLKAGDVVTAIDGQSVSKRSLSEVRSSLKTAALGRPLKIDYVRAGQRLT
ncbi:MAG TPA: aspartyl protease family protein, partial [Sphingomicrobium sp.]|nr:aspartyl protease family protein [Sphingomicrobium sp.]